MLPLQGEESINVEYLPLQFGGSVHIPLAVQAISLAPSLS